MQKKNLLLILLGLFVVIISLIYFLINSTLNERIFVKEKTFLTLKYGTSSDQIIKQFNTLGFFKPNWFFKYYLRYQYKIRKTFVSAGTYQIPSEITNSELINKLFTKELLFKNKLTIPEGSNIFEVARALKKHMKYDSLLVIKLLKNIDFIKSLGIESNTLEGYLTPETYFFEDNQKLEYVIKFLVENQKEHLERIEEFKNTNLSNYDILILASIIQAETSIEEEMPIVSSVYHNRLRIGMPLQADPTVLYTYFPEKIITKTMLRRPSPFNTYLKRGLPPTPINSPSKHAIFSAANPSNTDYLYFVAKSDTSLSHNFSTTYSEHLKNVKKYRNKTQ